jgi:hypothetical protein
MERLKATITRFLESKVGFAIFTSLTSLLGFLGGFISQPYIEARIERERVDYSMLFEKQAEAFDALASHYANKAVLAEMEKALDEARTHMKDDDKAVAEKSEKYKEILEELKARAQAESMREWQRARVLIATYGHPDQVRALYDYIETKWKEQIPGCDPPIAFARDVEIYQRFREQLFRGEDELENEEARKKLALIVHDCNLNPTSSASAKPGGG